MKLTFTGEKVSNDSGSEFDVLDIPSVDFNNAVKGRKSSPTLVIEAQGGEPTGQNFQAGSESVEYVAQVGDAIFVNSENDVYVPGGADGHRLQFKELESLGYINTGPNPDGDGILVKSPAAQILVEAVESPVCIKDAWGKGQHQFLYEGATLKLNHDGIVTGINQEAFDKTWEIA